MDIDKITKKLKNDVCSDLDVEVRSIDRIMIHTGYTYPDGDELHILLVESDGVLTFTDEGHTMMWLSYEDFNITESRRDVLDRALKGNNVSLVDGALSIGIDSEKGNMAFALKSLIQAELQVADLLYLDKENVRDTFLEDLKNRFLKSDISEHCKYDYTIVADGNVDYHADVFIDNKTPILVFGLHTPIQCARATVAMLSLNKSEMKYMFMIVFDDDTQISNNDHNKAINASHKTAVGIDEAIKGAHMLLEL